MLVDAIEGDEMKGDKMNSSELAMTMLEWEEKRASLDTLESAIKAAVLELGKTQTVGRVRASYSGGRASYNYQKAAQGHPTVSEDTIALFTTVPEPRVDWKSICEHAGIEEVPFTKSAPSVTLKLLEKK